MNVVFVHGWSVTDTSTYGDLPEALAANAPASLDISITHINLGEYISFHDEVTVSDIARAFEAARVAKLGANTDFSCITHSTGGPVIRAWVDAYYGADNLANLPMKHLVMLAPANHGSALAQLGKSRVGRIRSWFDGVEPGQRVLDWLELGSTSQRDLNLNWLQYKTVENGFYPVVITGDSISKSFIDYLNSYTDEKGSDGVVRVAAANMNYSHLVLTQDVSGTPKEVESGGITVSAYPLKLENPIAVPDQRCAFEIVKSTSHTGKKMGIMGSVTNKNATNRPVWQPLLNALQVDSAQSYNTLVTDMDKRTKENQKGHEYSMVVFRVYDDQGESISDFDLLFLCGKEYDAGIFPRKLFKDKQKNKKNNCALTYYIDKTLLNSVKDNLLGFRVVARPDKGFSYYCAGQFQSGDFKLHASQLINGNETLIVDIILKRNVDANTFVLVSTDEGGSFKKRTPSGKTVK